MATKTTAKKPIKLINKKSDYLIIDWDNAETYFTNKENLQNELRRLASIGDKDCFMIIDLNTECKFEIEEHKTFQLVKIIN